MSAYRSERYIPAYFQSCMSCVVEVTCFFSLTHCTGHPNVMYVNYFMIVMRSR